MRPLPPFTPNSENSSFRTLPNYGGGHSMNTLVAQPLLSNIENDRIVPTVVNNGSYVVLQRSATTAAMTAAAVVGPRPTIMAAQYFYPSNNPRLQNYQTLTSTPATLSMPAMMRPTVYATVNPRFATIHTQPQMQMQMQMQMQPPTSAVPTAYIKSEFYPTPLPILGQLYSNTSTAYLQPPMRPSDTISHPIAAVSTNHSATVSTLASVAVTTVATVSEVVSNTDHSSASSTNSGAVSSAHSIGVKIGGTMKDMQTKFYKCEICQRGFKYEGNLKAHLRKHSTNCFICKFCGKRFGRLSNMKEHERVHTGDKPFKCRYCPKKFSQHHSVVGHERTHTGERPYMCSLCGRRFVLSHHLKAHSVVHKNKVKKQCPSLPPPLQS